MIKFVYFDIGGTLLDWSNVFQNAAAKFNLAPKDIKMIFDENHDSVTKGSMSAGDLWKKCIEKYDLKNASDFDFLKSWVSDYRPITEMHDIVYKASSKYKVGFLSNIYKGMLPLLLKKKIIPDINYEQIIFSCDVGMMKPNPDIYALAQKKAGASPEEILLVDDGEDYLKGAKKAGWQTFLFNLADKINSCQKLYRILDLQGDIL